MLEFRSGGVR